MDGVDFAQVAVSPLGPDLEALGKQAATGDKQSIEGAASAFESVFLSLVIKEMRQTLEPDTLFGKDGGDVYGGLYDMYMGQHLARAGGFGLGQALKQQLQTRK